MSRLFAHAMDAVMCAMMNRMQWRLRHQACTRAELEAYLSTCEAFTLEDFYAAPASGLAVENPAGLVELSWPSPIATGFAENDTARALWFIGPGGPGAPTAIVNHALMSASDGGYRKLAQWFHARGWNMLFPHLPYHYSRTPRGYAGGGLAITANLPRNAEGLRQAVIEQRQLMAFLRGRGCPEIGVLGTSYGGWAASLLTFIEPDFRFVALIQPIIDVEHAIWDNPISTSLRRIVSSHGITKGISHRQSHLISPMHGHPLTDHDRIIVIAGAYDSVVPAAGLRELAAALDGAQFSEVPQGHFGYAALAEAKRRIEPLLSARR